MKFYYFNSTHWDREWYEPLQNFRRHLVETAKVLLEALEGKRGRLDKFTFDGQSIVLEDISLIHPDWKPRLIRQIAAGKLNVGPWFVQPDELLPSGESLVRNLQFGRQTCREFGGEPWPVCYVCDMFGHIAQTPQIFNGFDIHQAVLWRGVDRNFPPFFRWRSPDGSACDAIRLYSRFGYAEFGIFVLGLWETAPSEEVFKKNFRKYVEDVTPYFGENILLSDALDHIMPRIELDKIFRWIKDLYPQAEIIHTDYREMRQLFHDGLPTFTGELIRTADKPDHFGLLLSNCLSARYDLKYGNDRLQNRLELMAGPVQALAGLRGDTDSFPYWKLAWKHLVTDQAHDSIGGCSVDEVHRRMLQDYEEIGHLCHIFDEDLVYADRQACTGLHIREESNDCELAIRDAQEADENGNYHVRIFNALPFQRRETVDFEIQFPGKAPDYPAMGGDLNLLKPFFQFNLYDEQGQPIAFSVNQVRSHQVRRFYRHDSREYHIYKVSAPLTLRASGWTTVTVRPSSCPVRQLTSMMTSPMTAENEFLRLTVNADATFQVMDLRSGRTYDGMNGYEITRDLGDGWLYAQAQGTQQTIAATNGQVSILERSPFRTTFLLVREFSVSEALDYTGTYDFGFDQVAESPRSVTLKIKTTLSIQRGSDTLQAKTVIDNTIRDCRVRLVMPAFPTRDYFVYQNYAFLTRPVGRSSGVESASWPEEEPMEKNFSGIAGKRDDRGGIAFLSRYGLHEVAATDDQSGTVYVTLYRAFGRTVRNGGGTDCQLLKTLTWEYAYCFFDADRQAHQLYNQMQSLRCLPAFHTVAVSKCTLPAASSAVRVTGNVGYCTLSPAFSKPEDAILRLVNLSQQTQQVSLAFAAPVNTSLCELDEEREQPLASNCREVSFSMAPGKITTVMIRRPQEL